jgi:hypothetical protein
METIVPHYTELSGLKSTILMLDVNNILLLDHSFVGHDAVEFSGGISNSERPAVSIPKKLRGP